ncbi:HAD-IA family hydrolase [Actinospica durhamensis]|uniref:HAD-IA family hydrolase n=1 Tax=Actinospica durhamensis TaxID=1508375 RepID=A0A941EYR7_9ACTN|nr:HAD-IA family hydrolase [Actinospica durhamensis]MBR7836494.1 HAD-IA family hydrolase [Actinospica durhamensis]
MSAHLYSLPTAFPTADEDLAAPVPPIEAVLFDFANTLFRMLPTEQFLTRIWERAGREPGSIDAVEVAAQVRAAAGLAHVVEAQFERDTSPQRHRDATLAWFREVPALAGVEELAYEQVLLAETWYPYPDTAPVLRELAARGIPVGVVSDIPFDLRPIFAGHGLGEHVAAYALSYELGLEKPDPRMFLKACADLGADPRRTLMVGDNAPRDGGAVSANLRAYLLPSEPRTGERGLDAVLRLVG